MYKLALASACLASTLHGRTVHRKTQQLQLPSSEQYGEAPALKVLARLLGAVDDQAHGWQVAGPGRDFTANTPRSPRSRLGPLNMMQQSLENFQGFRCIVENLDYETAWQDLRKAFESEGYPIMYASLMTDQRTGSPTGRGVVQFETTDAAKHAINQMTGYVLDGREIRVLPKFEKKVDQAQRGSREQGDERGGDVDEALAAFSGGTQCVIGNVPEDIDSETLREAFSSEGYPIVSASISHEGKRPIGIVEFETAHAAKHAIKEMSGYDLNGGEIWVFPKNDEESKDKSGGWNTSITEGFEGTKVTVENLAPDTDWRTLANAFTSEGYPIVFASVLGSLSKPYGVVNFESNHAAVHAIHEMTGFKLKGHEIRVLPKFEKSIETEDKQRSDEEIQEDSDNIQVQRSDEEIKEERDNTKMPRSDDTDLPQQRDGKEEVVDEAIETGRDNIQKQRSDEEIKEDSDNINMPRSNDTGLHGQRDGRAEVVDEASEEGEEPSMCCSVSNLAPRTTWKMLKNAFVLAGYPIVHAEIEGEGDERVGILKFDCVKTAQHAIRQMSGMKMDGNKLEVRAKAAPKDRWAERNKRFVMDEFDEQVQDFQKWKAEAREKPQDTSNEFTPYWLKSEAVKQDMSSRGTGRGAASNELQRSAFLGRGGATRNLFRRLQDDGEKSKDEVDDEKALQRGKEEAEDDIWFEADDTDDVDDSDDGDDEMMRDPSADQTAGELEFEDTSADQTVDELESDDSLRREGEDAYHRWSTSMGALNSKVPNESTDVSTRRIDFQKLAEKNANWQDDAMREVELPDSIDIQGEDVGSIDERRERLREQFDIMADDAEAFDATWKAGPPSWKCLNCGVFASRDTCFNCGAAKPTPEEVKAAKSDPELRHIVRRIMPKFVPRKSSWTRVAGTLDSSTNVDEEKVMQMLNQRDSMQGWAEHERADVILDELGQLGIWVDEREPTQRVWWAGRRMEEDEDAAFGVDPSVEWIKKGKWKRTRGTQDKYVDVDEDEVLALLYERDAAREEKDFVRADMILDELASAGIKLQDDNPKRRYYWVGHRADGRFCHHRRRRTVEMINSKWRY